MSTTSNPIFTGTSQFSASLQQAIAKAISQASQPIQQMQGDVTTLESQGSELSTLSSDFSALQSAVSGIESAVGSGSYTPSVSNSSVASVALSGTPGTGSFSVTVDDLGAYSTALSNAGLPAVADPAKSSISDATQYTLSVGGTLHTITPASNTLSALADAINASGYAQAIVLNLGTASAPSYQLSLQGTELGDLPLELTAVDGSNPGQTLLTPETTGAPATYQINGQPSTPLQSNSRTITAAPGVSVTMLETGTTTVTVGRSTFALASALQTFTSAYNKAQSEINNNRGQSGGALGGQSILSSLSQALDSLSGYSSGTSGMSSLIALGFSFDQSGVLSFDPTTLNKASTADFQQLSDFLGSSKTGGFLKLASDTLTGITDSDTGVLPLDISSIQDQITTTNRKISDQQSSLNTLQTNLQNQMAAADASIAAMEQQFLYLNEMFQAMQQYNNNGL